MRFPNPRFSGACSMALLILAGCTSDLPKDQSEGKAEPRRGPRLTFHRPDDLPTAIQRLGEIHTQLMESDELPAPRRLDYVEVIHGEGASAHSHYYLASEFDDSQESHPDDHEDDDHGEMKESIRRDTYSVDWRTELEDLALWLPDIAAKSDLDQEDWNGLKDASQQLHDIIEAIGEEVGDADFRDAWRDREVGISRLITQMREYAGKAGGS